jgi:6-pyruvoyltetrahydropterin/6-carboxytetrahydropterin synthase
MFEVRVETTFEAAHQVGPDGAPLPLHHHSWQVAVRARAEELDSIGLVVDFRQLRAAADEAVALLDQRVIEDVPDFAERPSTPAAVAEWLFRKLEPAVPSPRCWLEAVEVEADPGIRFEYSGRGAD